jgi:hypothetical protein
MAIRVTGGNLGRRSLFAERGIEAATEHCLAALTAKHAEVVRVVAVLGTGTTLAEASAVVGVTVGEVRRAAQASGLVTVVDDRLEICPRAFATCPVIPARWRGATDPVTAASRVRHAVGRGSVRDRPILSCRLRKRRAIRSPGVARNAESAGEP